MKKKNGTILTLSFLLTLSACTLITSSRHKKPSEQVESVDFASLSLPRTEAELTSIRVSPQVTVTFQDGSRKVFPLSYETVYRNGDKIDDTVVGSLVKKDGSFVTDKKGVVVTDRIDGNSVIKQDGKYYLITHFETYPGALYLTELERDTQSGKFSAKKFSNIDFSSINGTMNNCASSVTPWNTHLSAEEDYYFDGASFDDAAKAYTVAHISDCPTDAMGNLLGYEPFLCHVTRRLRDVYLDKSPEFTPYNYGYIFEVGIGWGKGHVSNELKHYAMGKGSPEMALVMPDQRTVYITDDGNFRGLYMFIADQKGDLARGTLYMARWEQTSVSNNGAANLKWIRLGHASDAEVKKIIDKNPKFTDIFEIGKIETCNQDGFKMIKSGDSKPMCLRLRDGSHNTRINKQVFASPSEVRTAAAFLETKRYGVYHGATAEFRKEEAITYDFDRNVLYLAMSEINGSMVDNYKGEEPQNHIKLPRNDCGAIYEIGFGNNYDYQGMHIDSEYVGAKTQALLGGQPLKAGEKYADQHYCHPDAIANPDNVDYIGKNLLFIAEDTDLHTNGFAWVYDLKKKKLTRIMSAPLGAEFAGMFSDIAVDKRHYIFVTAQHPFKDYSINANGEAVNASLLDKVSDEQKRSYVGYIHGLPALD